LTVVALLEAVSEGEATVEMNSENAVALRAVAEVVEASIIEIILKVATTKIRTITLASPKEAEGTGALAALRGPVASTSHTILKDLPWALVEVATKVSGRRMIDLR
jgi:hypothetical protein